MSFASCGSDEDEDNPDDNTSIVGTWKNHFTDEDGEYEDEGDLFMMFTADGKFFMSVDGELENEGTYSMKGKDIIEIKGRVLEEDDFYFQEKYRIHMLTENKLITELIEVNGEDLEEGYFQEWTREN